jgi:putative heme-binding domain-containing protein
VQPQEISLADRQRLASSSDPALKQLATELLPSQPQTSRTDVLDKYKDSLALTGNAEQGRKLFARDCMACHVLGDIGHAVGPDLAALRGKDPDYWLKNILDPNAVVEPRFVAYEIETTDGRALSGIIQSETASSLTIISGSGVSEVLPRSEISDIRASSLSLMPEGLETAMTPQEMADLLAFVIPRAPRRTFAGNDPGLVFPGPGGVLLLPAARAEIFGGEIAFEAEFKNIGLWHRVDEYIAWTFEVTQAGPHDVHMDYACANGSAGNAFRLTVADQSVSGKITGTGPAWNRYLQVKIGTIELPAGRHRLTFRPDTALRGALVDLRTLALAPPGQTPPWPAATSAAAAPAAGTAAARDQLLRDPASIARYLLDPAQPADAREAVIRANPQFAGDFIVEMTKDLQPGTPAEYERIPWIWRVAIACGKRNEPVEIKRVLAASLPQPGTPLRDWQAVVIGGGIINGLSQRGVWPAQHLGAIVSGDPLLLQRWQRALDLAAAMSDDPKVPAGTRYDALRMLGMEPWEKRGAQLARYLAKGTHAELQMGAVSGLGDLPSPQAAAALVAALDHLSGGNRDLALDALLRDDSRALALLDSAGGRGWKAADLGPARVAKLLDHPNPGVRAQARRQLAPE